MVAALPHAFVDIGRAGQSFGQHEDGLVDHRAQDAVHHESRAVAHRNRRLALPAPLSLSLLTRRSRFLSIACRPRCTAASLMSSMMTRRPAIAHDCAIPLPMVPAPITPTVLIVILMVSELIKLASCAARRP